MDQERHEREARHAEQQQRPEQVDAERLRVEESEGMAS